MFRIINDYVILKKILLGDKSSSILLKMQEVDNIGTVISVKETSKFKENDRVLFNESKAISFQYNNEEYLYISEKDIIAILV